MWHANSDVHGFNIEFLLTHPVWDVTHKHLLEVYDRMHFYSHIPCGMWRIDQRRININANQFLLTHPVWDVTSSTRFISYESCRFLLTHPVWDVTIYQCNVRNVSTDFYSHIPCGMWRGLRLITALPYSNFYSHIPCGMWRMIQVNYWMLFMISTHTSRVGCDCSTRLQVMT